MSTTVLFFIDAENGFDDGYSMQRIFKSLNVIDSRKIDSQG